jgi:hypothetical protein
MERYPSEKAEILKKINDICHRDDDNLNAMKEMYRDAIRAKAGNEAVYDIERAIHLADFEAIMGAGIANINYYKHKKRDLESL